MLPPATVRVVAKPPKRFLPTLVIAEVLLTTLEVASVIVPLVTFFPDIQRSGTWLVAVGLLVAIWTGAMAGMLRPLLRTVRPDRYGPTYRLALRLPGIGLALRVALWITLSVIGSLMLRRQGVIGGWQMVTVLAICINHSLIVSVLRWAFHTRLLRSTVEHMRIQPSWLEGQADTLFQQLIEVALVLGAVTAGFLGLFVFLFVPISLEQFLVLETCFPWGGVVLAAIWYFGVAPRLVAPLIAYLRRAGRGEAIPRDELRRAAAVAHRLPTVLALIKLGFFVVAGALLAVEAVLLSQFTPTQGVLVACAVSIVSIGTAIYELIWTRTVLRPIVAHLLAQPGVEQLPMRTPSLRRKLLISFGGVLVFTVVLPLFWSFLQYGNLRNDSAGAQAERELATLLDRLHADPERAAQMLQRTRPVEGSRYLLVPAAGRADPLLSRSMVETIRRREDGTVTLQDEALSGAYRRIDPTRPALGSVVVLVPVVSDETGSAEGRMVRGVRIYGLVFFFAAILAIAIGVVWLTSADLTLPLASLEQRATEMAQGRLDQRMLPAGEFDEIGRLTAAFESMRRALQEKIRTIERLNVGLEAKVQERTAALERSTSELLAAFTALQVAQQRLITSEKMASVGQLVAGIAHEINNPINAVINTVGPLTEALRQQAGEASGESHEELEAMLRVISSGAQRTQRIVQALRNYSRRDGEALSRMDLHADIDESLALLQHNLRGVEVRREFTARGELTAYRGELNQALVNLLSNAAAALEGRPGACLTVRTRDRDDTVEIEVQDNGPGIPPEIQARVFDPFFTTKEVGKGTGLGLSITHGIVERHGGKISLRSGNSGTTFTMLIPRKQEP